MKTILIVEDERNLRAMYAQELEAEGYEVIAVPDAATAKTTCRENDIDLAILDIKLDGPSGIDVLQHLAKEHREVKVIINTAYPSYKNDFQTWSADAYVVKSSDLDELKSKVRELVFS
jgi:DNA-binding response OmpR family regulator